MTKFVTCPMCGGTGTIEVPYDNGQSKWWIIPNGVAAHTRRTTEWCPFCEVGRCGLVRVDHAAAFALCCGDLTFRDTGWIKRADFEKFMDELGRQAGL